MVNSFLRRALRSLYFKGCLRYCKEPVTRLGSEYGGWNVPIGFLNEKSICYLAGADLDISFDVEVASKYKAQVHIFDPSQKSYDHYKELQNHVCESKSMLFKDGRYCIGLQEFNLLKFHNLAFWQDVEKINLQSTMISLGHSKIDLLKLRIGGGEYKVVACILENKLDIDLLCIRFDELHKPADWQFLARIRKQIKLLKLANYKIISIDNHYNITFARK